MDEKEVSTQNTEQDDEISLVDLLAVIIRYRKLIIWGTVAVFAVVAFYYFALPQFIPSMKKKTLTATYTVYTYDVPASIKSNLSITTGGNYINSKLLERLQNRPYMAREVKRFPAFKFEGGSDDPYAYNKFITDLYDKSKISMGASETYVSVTLKVAPEGLNDATALVADTVTTLNGELENDVMPRLRELQKQIPESVKGGTITLEQSLQMNQDLAKFFSNHKNFAEIKDEPFVISDAQGRTKQVIIATFAALFIFIFLAFLINAGKNVKKDPVASKTLADAWQNRK